MIEVSRDFVLVKLYPYNLQQIQQYKLLDVINTALAQNRLSTTDLHQKRIVFDTLFEGHGPTEFLAVLDSLKDQDWYDVSRIVFLNNVFDVASLPVKSVSWPWNMVNHSGWFEHLRSLELDWENIVRDRYFVCLMRRRSTQRSRLLKEILSRYDSLDYQISYASMIDYTAFDDIAGVQIPILLDAPTPGQQQHRADDPRIFSCLINIIVETSNQEPPGEQSWTSRFASEKTFKCFGWHQIPLWWTMPGLVNDVRSLGFDVFDDVMSNHDYDNQLDPQQRMCRMLDILQNSMRLIHTTGIQKFHNMMLPRLQSNYQKLLEFSDRRMSHWSEIMNRVRTI